MATDDLKPIAVVLFTGGMDSTATAHYVKNAMGCETYGLTLQQFDDGDIVNWKEISVARRMCSFLGIQHMVYDASAYADLVNKQVTNSCNYKEGNDDDIKLNFIPNRNALFLLLGHSLCQSLMNAKKRDVGYVMTGLIESDPKYPDSNLQYFNDLDDALSPGILQGTISILSPLYKYTKGQIVQYLKRHKIPLELTWSCNTNNDEPCGECFGCTQLNKLKNDTE